MSAPIFPFLRARALVPSARVVLGLTLALAACDGGAAEAPRVELPVAAGAAGPIPVTTDLGYQVELTTARLVIEDLELTIAGEVHSASVGQALRRLLVGTARAHPGHYQGGEVTGELKGRYVLDFTRAQAEELGRATLLAGAYQAANFTFGRASEDEVERDDPLFGHTALLEGVARRDGAEFAFRAVLDSPEGRELVGVPFVANVRASAEGTLALQLLTRDQQEGDTLFDGLDFASLPSGQGGSIVLDATAGDDVLADAYARLRRALQTHDHFALELKE